jgi:hypothetical protein
VPIRVLPAWVALEDLGFAVANALGVGRHELCVVFVGLPERADLGCRAHQCTSSRTMKPTGSMDASMQVKPPPRSKTTEIDRNPPAHAGNRRDCGLGVFGDGVELVTMSRLRVKRRRLAPGTGEKGANPKVVRRMLLTPVRR